jgi:parvulin-like peptidyl-prolyl isomerase
MPAKRPDALALHAPPTFGILMRLRITFLPVVLLLAVVLVAAGCGSGSESVPANSVARVGSDTITKTQFNFLLDGARRTYKARKQSFPKAGTTAYKSLQDQAMQYLVQESELQQKADDMGIKITDADVNARLKSIKQQYFGGSEKKYQSQLKAQGLTEPQIKQDLYAQILSEKLYDKVTSDVKVTDADISKYYNSHKSDYQQAASRDVRHILVNDKKLADSLYQQLKGGADFATLAKKYSKDPGSKNSGGKLTITKGQTVAPFDKTAFALKTNELSKPVHTQYGWHVIQALTAIKPAQTKSESSVAAQIKSQLLQNKQKQAVNDWSKQLQKDYCKDSQISYQAGFTPSPDPCAAAAATTTTSG